MSKRHVYMMPGLAANPSIFEYISLPDDAFEVHWLDWMLPEPKEALTNYAQRMSQRVTEPDPVLLGVSFGGVLVQEMSKYLNPSRIVIVSSVKNKRELPKRMKLAKATQVHKLLPTCLVNNVELLSKYTMGEKLNKRVALYKKYLSVRDKRYLDWCIDQLVNWKQQEAMENIVHIHGERDTVFPINHIKDCIRIRDGTHAMIIYKHRWFNEHLPQIIQG